MALGAAGFFGFLLAVEELNKKEYVAQVEETSRPRERVDPPDAKEILDLVNREREEQGVQPLVVDQRLDVSAQYKASDMEARDYFSHVDPDTGVKNGLDKADELVNGACSYIGENIQRNGVGNTSQATFDSWKSSRSHYEAMINPDYVYTGIGISGVYVVQHFCY